MLSLTQKVPFNRFLFKILSAVNQGSHTPIPLTQGQSHVALIFFQQTKLHVLWKHQWYVFFPDWAASGFYEETKSKLKQFLQTQRKLSQEQVVHSTQGLVWCGISVVFIRPFWTMSIHWNVLQCKIKSNQSKGWRERKSLLWKYIYDWKLTNFM